MQVHFQVFKVSLGGTSDGGVRLRMLEYGTHHRFVAYIRDPKAAVYLHQELGKFIDQKGWKDMPPNPEAQPPLPPARDVIEEDDNG